MSIERRCWVFRGILVQTSPPRAIWTGEIKFRAELLRHPGMVSKCLAFVRCDRVYPGTKRAQEPHHPFPHRLGRLAFDPRQQRQLRGAINQQDNGPVAPFADDRVSLPVPHAPLLLHHSRTLANVHPPGDVPAPRMLATLPVRFFPRRRNKRSSRPPALRSARTWW